MKLCSFIIRLFLVMFKWAMLFCSLCVICNVYVRTQTQRSRRVRGVILSGVRTGTWSLSPFSAAVVPLKVNSGINMSYHCVAVVALIILPTCDESSFSSHSLGSIRSLGVCCPRLRIPPPLSTGWGSLPRTTSWPNLASGTLSLSWGRWRRHPERSSTVAWWVSV